MLGETTKQVDWALTSLTSVFTKVGYDHLKLQFLRRVADFYAIRFEYSDDTLVQATIALDGRVQIKQLHFDGGYTFGHYPDSETTDPTIYHVEAYQG